MLQTAVSNAEAHFWPTGWFRAVYADDTPVGFVMVDNHYLAGEDRRLELQKKGCDDYDLWRRMIDGEHQASTEGKAMGIAR